MRRQRQRGPLLPRNRAVVSRRSHVSVRTHPLSLPRGGPVRTAPRAAWVALELPPRAANCLGRRSRQRKSEICSNHQSWENVLLPCVVPQNHIKPCGVADKLCTFPADETAVKGLLSCLTPPSVFSIHVQCISIYCTFACTCTCS